MKWTTFWKWISKILGQSDTTVKQSETPLPAPDVLPSDLTPAPDPDTLVPDPGPAPEVPKYLWDTRANIIHSIRVLCDEYGLSWTEKADLCATIEAESNFNLKAKNQNKRGGKVISTDWGIVQINDFYHIGTGKSFPSVEYVLDNPEKCVRFMIVNFEAGKKDWWIAYKSGAYRKFVKKYL